VVLSNFMTALISFSVTKLGAPFHAFYTAEEAGACKPRMKAFEYMLDGLGCAPGDVLHCSSSYRRDLMTAHDMRFGHKLSVNREHEPANAFYGAYEVQDLGELPKLLGL
jgi:2-haloacid dehalogenase